MSMPSTAATPIPWKRGVLWLLFLGPLFFASYGYANRLAAERTVVDSVFFAWETHIPFLPWTILPYWSIDLLYGLAFLCCRSHGEVDRLGLRLLTAQIVSVTFFIAFPLRFAFERPATDGLAGTLFDALSSFDQPYNQAPSLHIGLLVIIWVQFARLPVAAPVRALVHAWALLIGVSVLTTMQHHFVDIPTGAAVGLLCLWLWPHGNLTTPLRRGADAGAFGLTALYAGGALLAACAAVMAGGVALWLGWAALALALVAINYGWSGANGFQKQDGRQSVAARWLFAPYTLGARLNAWLWTRRCPAADHVAEGVWIGALYRNAGQFPAVFDLAAELPAPKGLHRHDGTPCLDLVAADPARLADVATRIEALRGRGDILVACALGFSRSAAAVATWLGRTGRAADADEAIERVRRARPQVVLGPAWREAIVAALRLPHPSGIQHDA
jgi:hypothetical protein